MRCLAVSGALIIILRPTAAALATYMAFLVQKFTIFSKDGQRFHKDIIFQKLKLAKILTKSRKLCCRTSRDPFIYPL